MRPEACQQLTGESAQRVADWSACATGCAKTRNGLRGILISLSLSLGSVVVTINIRENRNACRGPEHPVLMMLPTNNRNRRGTTTRAETDGTLVPRSLAGRQALQTLPEVLTGSSRARAATRVTCATMGPGAGRHAWRFRSGSRFGSVDAHRGGLSGSCQVLPVVVCKLTTLVLVCL